MLNLQELWQEELSNHNKDIASNFRILANKNKLKSLVVIQLFSAAWSTMYITEHSFLYNYQLFQVKFPIAGNRLLPYTQWEQNIAGTIGQI